MYCKIEGNQDNCVNLHVRPHYINMFFNFKKKPIQGFVYANDEASELFKNAKVGDIIMKPNRNIPFIVVDHTLDKMIITRWPGKLYKVEVLNQSKEKDLNKGLAENVWYTRTLGVKILEEMSLENLFGTNGKWISQIVDVTRNISEEQVDSLSNFDAHPGRELFSKAWKNWISLMNKDDANFDEDYSNTLAILDENHDQSPIGRGLTLISSQFYIRAREIAGESAFGIDDEGEIFLQPKWSKACEKLLHAGMSYESLNLLSESEKMVLRKPMTEVFNMK